jgi:hypothetical protein
MDTERNFVTVTLAERLVQESTGLQEVLRRIMAVSFTGRWPFGGSGQ